MNPNIDKQGKTKSRNKLLWVLAVLSFFSFGCSDKPLKLSWQDTSDNEDGFRIYRVTPEGKTKIADVGANVTGYTDKNPGRNACYVVTAFNSAGESPASEMRCPADSAIVSRRR